MQPTVSFIGNITNLLSAPNTAFSYLKEKPSVLFALLFILFTSILTMVFYFSQVDFPWLLDSMINQQTQGKSADEIAAIRQGMSHLTPMIMGMGTVASVLIIIPVFMTFIATYLLLVNKIADETSLSFKHWFSLVCWSSIPMVFTSLASFVNILLATDGQLSLVELNPISFNNLFIHLEQTDRLFGPISNWDFMTVWSTVLLVIGYQQWMQKGLVKSAAIVLAPTVIVYGVWIAFVI